MQAECGGCARRNGKWCCRAAPMRGAGAMRRRHVGAACCHVGVLTRGLLLVAIAAGAPREPLPGSARHESLATDSGAPPAAPFARRPFPAVSRALGWLTSQSARGTFGLWGLVWWSTRKGGKQV